MKAFDLELIKNESERIIESLPIAHYLKVDTMPIVFDESAETSYFDPYKFNIHIALCNIVEALKGRKSEEISELELEKTIRCFLYHEISHAILTPKLLKADIADFNKYYTKDTLLTPMLVNILEDERIETILKDYYLLVDFRENLRNACGKATEPTTFEHFVFNAIRLKSSPKSMDLIKLRLKAFIQDTKTQNAGSGSYCLLRNMWQFLKFLKEIWDKIVEEKDKAESESDDSHSSSSEDEREKDKGAERKEDTSSKEESIESSKKESKDKSSSKEEKADTTKSKGEIAGDESSKEDSVDDDTSIEIDDEDLLTDEERDSTIESSIESMKMRAARVGGRSMKLSDYTSDEKTKLELLKTIIRNAGVGVQNQQALYGYSGRFNAKRFMKDYMTGNDTYKWFEKKAFESGETTTRKSGKKILNIWLDQSGSFNGNDAEVNKLLKALAEIEATRNDFEWRLIKLTCTVEVVKDKEKRYSKSHTGNALPIRKMLEAYKQVNASQTEFNVVLFDGPANSLDFTKEIEGQERDRKETYSFDALKPFNNKRTVFITESSNFGMIKAICPEAKETILANGGYSTVLAENVIKALDLLF